MQVTLPNGEIASCERIVHMAWTNPGEEVDRRTRALVAKYPGRSYSAAMHIVLDEDEVLKQAFAQQPFDRRRNERPAAVRFGDGSAIARDNFREESGTPGDRLHAKVQELRKQHCELTYSTALEAVLSDPENAALKLAFAMER
jgi:hypothetical protein